jgi:hypothetical protein
MQAPYKPLNPYMSFSKQERPSLVLSFPELKSSEIMQKIGLMWRELDKKKKEQIEQNYQKELV